MNQYKTSVNVSWFDKNDDLGYKISMWSKKASVSEIYCNICSISISVEKKGFQAIQQHASTKKHKLNSQLKLSTQQQHLLAVSLQDNEKKSVLSMQSFSTRDLATKAELIWSMKTVLSNYSGSSCDGLFETFQAMFGDSIPRKFTLGRTKLSYIINEALGP